MILNRSINDGKFIIEDNWKQSPFLSQEKRLFPYKIDSKSVIYQFVQ
jgi:hypothetical protein